MAPSSPTPSEPKSPRRDKLPPRRKPRRRGRNVNLYDVIAGRVTLNQPLRNPDGTSKPTYLTRNTPLGRYHSKAPSLTDDEVLSRKRCAPPRFEEGEVHITNVDLPDGGRGILPDSDLLTSMLSYSAKFYHVMARRVAGRQGRSVVDEKSMDGSALMALGILLEEAGREALGRRGDLVFTEGLGVREGDDDGGRWMDGRYVGGWWRRGRWRLRLGRGRRFEGGDAEDGDGDERPKAKRRKVVKAKKLRRRMRKRVKGFGRLRYHQLEAITAAAVVACQSCHVVRGLTARHTRDGSGLSREG
ncbi:hypothetical protein B0T17DRAFT_496674 [Bombardia bombarda]|uniref:Uncharacterized protein n=1 Tax=Bombardia bombarda TaxID=252184 RepID=A0AA39WIH6_9PEZI|nr:hypothetical protein B0T17DRAFT_496674 [Bombardia bombarda]